MTERSILAGTNPNVVVKAGASVTVKGWDSEHVLARADNHWGLKVEKHHAAEVGRARTAVGERVLFDVRLKLPGRDNVPGEVIEVQVGGSGEVFVPFGANLKVYAGKDIAVQGIRGQMDAYAGFKLSLQEVACLGNASAGGAMNLDCRTLRGENVEFKAGGDIRFYVHDLTSARLRVKDIGGYWEARIGAGAKSVYLKSGGDVTLVTDQQVEPLPPDFILGKIERPAAA